MSQEPHEELKWTDPVPHNTRLGILNIRIAFILHDGELCVVAFAYLMVGGREIYGSLETLIEEVARRPLPAEARWTPQETIQ